MNTTMACAIRHSPVTPRCQRGASLVLVTVSLVALLGFAALALDVGNLYVARNELQNAADSGALAGARVLYVADGTMVNVGANARARTTARLNSSQGTPVEVEEVASVQRGHWSFATSTFSPSTSLEPVDLFDRTAAELDGDLNFINAIEVTTERKVTPVQAFVGSVLGLGDYALSATAVGYIGFAGKLNPGDVDQPIALCRDAIVQDDAFSCSVGRFVDSNSETGAWTNFQQDNSGATNANELRKLVEGDGNPDEILYGEDMATNNGQVQSAFKALYDRWVAETDKERLWGLSLPVIDCSDGIASSAPVVGAVNVNIVWIIDGANKIDDDAPRRMELPPDDSDGFSPGDWQSAETDGITRWNDFVSSDNFNLRLDDGTQATSENGGWRQKSIHFLPSCEAHEPTGQTGGENFGVLAEIPVLVD